MDGVTEKLITLGLAMLMILSWREEVEEYDVFEK